MKNLKREKNLREAIEKKLAKYERRMQRISEESFQLRVLLEQLDEAKKKETPAEPVADAAPVDPAVEAEKAKMQSELEAAIAQAPDVEVSVDPAVGEDKTVIAEVTKDGVQSVS